MMTNNGIIPFPQYPNIVIPSHSGLPMFSTENGGPVIQNVGDSIALFGVLWEFEWVRDNVYYIKSETIDGYLQPLGKSTASEATITTAYFDGDVFQQWEFIRVSSTPGGAPLDVFYIRNVGSGLYLDVFQDSLEIGTKYIQYPLSGNIFNQRFLLTPIIQKCC